MLIAGIILAVVGFCTVLLARHGFMVGTHPFCSACNFNLTGLPEKHARCPECGADILRDGSVRIGYRRPVFAGMVFGVMIIVGAAVCVAAGVAHWWETFDASRWKPVAMLEKEMLAPREVLRAAIRELTRRIDVGSLSRAQSAQLADLIVKLQGDSAQAWDERWGDVLQNAHERDQVSGSAWLQYLQQAIHGAVFVRPRVAADAHLPFRIECQLKAGTNFVGLTPAYLTPKAVFTGARLPASYELPPLQLMEYRMPLEWSQIGIVNCPPGVNNIRVSLTITLTERTRKPVSATFAQDLTFEVMPPNGLPVGWHTGTPDEQKEMQAAMKWRLAAGAVKIRPGQETEFGSLFVSGPPVATDFRVMLRQEKREWMLARLLVRANDATQIPLELPAMVEAAGPHAGAAEIVCVPEGELAAATPDVMEVWGEEIHRPVMLEMASSSQDIR